jgi:hypothetical protein
MCDLIDYIERMSRFIKNILLVRFVHLLRSIAIYKFVGNALPVDVNQGSFVLVFEKMNTCDCSLHQQAPGRGGLLQFYPLNRDVSTNTIKDKMAL